MVGPLLIVELFLHHAVVLFFKKMLAYLRMCIFCRTFAKNCDMNESTPALIYQQPSIEFVTVAVQLCLYLERIQETEKEDFVEKMLCMLPLLYLKARLVPREKSDEETYLERFVTETDYDTLRERIRELLGSEDSFLEVHMEDMRYSDEPITAFISENIADIYQELKDLACNYQSENESVMTDALLACLDAFEQHWGQKLLNILRPLHALSLPSEYE
jgi:hypothetical protein